MLTSPYTPSLEFDLSFLISKYSYYYNNKDFMCPLMLCVSSYVARAKGDKGCIFCTKEGFAIRHATPPLDRALAISRYMQADEWGSSECFQNNAYGQRHERRAIILLHERQHPNPHKGG